MNSGAPISRSSLAKPHHYPGVFATQRTDGPQRDPGQTLQDTHGDSSPQHPPRRVDRDVHLADGGQALRAAATNASPAVVGNDAVRGAIEQRHVEFPLDRAHRRRHRRLH